MNQQLIDLTKKVEVVLDLRKIADLKAQVHLTIDGSGSMDYLYRNGTVQKTVDRLSAVAVKFDDNQELDVSIFSSGVNEAEPATPAMFGSYVDQELLRKNLVPFGGTYYVPFINLVVEKYFSQTLVAEVKTIMEKVEIASKGVFGALKDALFGKKTEEVEKEVTTTKTVSTDRSVSGLPIFVIVITDGENGDQSATTALLKKMENKNVYWQFVGIGNTRFPYLEQVAKELPNVGFFSIQDLATVKDMDLYKQLVSEEFAKWAKKF